MRIKVISAATKRVCSVLLTRVLCAVLILTMTPFMAQAFDSEHDTYMAYAESNIANITGEVEDIVISISGSDIVAKRQNTGTTMASAPIATGLTLTGTTNNHIFRVQGTGTFNLTLSNLNMALTDTSKPAPIYIDGASAVNLKLSGTSSLTNSNDDDAVIEINNPSNQLNISGSGKLSVKNTGDYGAGIGTGKNGKAGTIKILSGTIDVVTQDGAGIGAGGYGICSDIAVSGGTINYVAEDSDAAGIGSGSYATCGAISISGGIINITEHRSSLTAGIGGGYGGTCSDIKISGGKIDIKDQLASAGGGAGIGSGFMGICGNISITGGQLAAKYVEIGIGNIGGYGGICGDISITNGIVNVSDNSVGIGGARCGDITISGGTVSADSESHTGIGSANGGSICGDITINGGKVSASGGIIGGAGIGSGGSNDFTASIVECGKITISGGTVRASSSVGAGIGSGEYSKVIGKIIVSGGTVYASTSDSGAGIGTGKNGTVTGDIELTGGNIYTYSEGAAKIGAGTGGTVQGVVRITLPVSVRFNAAGGSPTPSAQTYHYADTYYNINENIKREGYTFGGWFADDGFGHISRVKDGTKMLMTGTHTPSARWTPLKYKVNFDANGGKVSMKNKDVAYEAAFGTLPAPTRNKYTFMGWYTAKTGGTKITATSKMNKIGGMTLYAHWAEADATLKSLKATKGKFTSKFKASKKSYTLNLKPSQSSVKIAAKKKSAAASLHVKIGKGKYKKVKSVNAKVKLKKGKSATVYIKVVAADAKTTIVYKVKVKRAKK